MLLGQRLEESINALSELTARVPKQIEMIKQEMKLCELENEDLLHYTELSNLNACDGYKLYKDMKITLMKRRELKDELELLEKLQKRMGKNNQLTTHAVILSSDFDRQKNRLSDRRYHLRVRKDLTPQFNKIHSKQGKVV